jgi:hypothetical protein
VWQGAAIGVAQDDPARAGIEGRLRASQRVFRVGLVAVEEMLAVDHRFLAGGECCLHAVGDAGEVLVVGGLQRHADMVVPGLGDKAHRIGPCLHQVLQAGVVGGGAPCPPGHAEGGKRCLHLARLGKQRGVGLVGAGVAALDIIEAKLVQQPDDRQLVFQREVDARRLPAIAQRRVVQVEPVQRSHYRTPFQRRAR